MEMKLTTKRLILRLPTLKDTKNLAEQANNLEVSRMMCPVPYPYTLKDAKWFVLNCQKKAKENPRTHFGCVIELKEEKKVIGVLTLEDINYSEGYGDYGYWIGEKYWGQGIMTEALEAFIDFAFKKLKLNRLQIACFVENKGSEAIAKKLGFKLEGTIRQGARSKATGKTHDYNIYGLLKKEWKRG